MKLAVLLFALLTTTMLACTKQKTDSLKKNGLESMTLAGNWRMVAVTDNASSSTITKPSSEQGNVDITFSTANNNSAGTFFGHTPTNDISNSDYSTGINQLLKIHFLAMTKVQETAWGKEFVDNIRDAQQYSFDKNNDLLIKTINKTLTFRRH